MYRLPKYIGLFSSYNFLKFYYLQNCLGLSLVFYVRIMSGYVYRHLSKTNICQWCLLHLVLWSYLRDYDSLCDRLKTVNWSISPAKYRSTEIFDESTVTNKKMFLIVQPKLLYRYISVKCIYAIFLFAFSITAKFISLFVSVARATSFYSICWGVVFRWCNVFMDLL